MCKSIVIGMLVVVMMVATSGCNMVDGALEDGANTLQAVRDKVTTPMADKAKARDAKRSAKQLTRHHQEQAGRFAAFASNEEVK